MSAGAVTPRFLNDGGEMGALVRSHDWSKTPLGPPDAWPQSLRTVVRLMLTTNHPMFVFWGSDHICLYNDAYCASLGPEKHPSMLGAGGRQMWDEIWHIIGPQIDRVMSGQGATWNENQLVPIIRHGKLDDVYWTYGYSPIDDETSQSGVGGVLVICTETTGKLLVEQQLREANGALDRANAQLTGESARLTGFFEAAPSFMAVLQGPTHVFQLANAAYLKLVGQRDLVGRAAREAFPDVEGQGFFELLDQVYATGEAFVGRGMPIAFRNESTGAVEERFIDFVYQPIVDAYGLVSGIFVDGHDITEHLQSEQAVRSSEERFRSLANAMPQLVWTANADGFIDWYNEGWYDYTGATPADMVGWGWQSVHDPEMLPSVMTRWQASIASGDPFEMTFPLRGSDGVFRPFLTRVVPQKDTPGRVIQWFGTNTDIEALRRAEEQQDLLLREMDHRVKNLFAVVGGVVTLSTRSAATPRDLADVIQGRLGALASAHQLIRPRDANADRKGQKTDFDQLVREILSPYLDTSRPEDTRVTIRGPDILVGGDAVTSFALILHELATNAAKYGAFSTPDGHVTINWSTQESQLQMTWGERGGPVILAPPEREGFGSLLARKSAQGQLGGQVTYSWDRDGLQVRLSAALDRLES